MKKIFRWIWLPLLLLCFQNSFASRTCGKNVYYEIDGSLIKFSRENSEKTAEWATDCTEVFRYNNEINSVAVMEKIYAPANSHGLFEDCNYVKKMYLAYLDVSKVKDMGSMFKGCTWLRYLDVSAWNTSEVMDMSGMFYGCSLLPGVDLSEWRVYNVLYMGSMFQGCSLLETLDISEWYSFRLIETSGMFSGCSLLETLDLSGWNTSSVVFMTAMFRDCSSLKTLNVKDWNTAAAREMQYMFSGCTHLTSLDLSGWDTSRVNDASSMFTGCKRLHTLTLGKNTVQTNIFLSLPAYSSSWYYAGQNASDPLALNTEREDGRLFKDYNYKNMAGTWTTTHFMIKNPAKMDITGKTIKVSSKTYQLKTAAVPVSAAKQFTWESSNTAVAVVDSTGKVTFRKAGTVRITATANDGTGIALWVKLTTEIKAAKVTIKNSAGGKISRKTIKTSSKTYQLIAVASPVKFAEQKFTWKSSDKNIATVKAGKVTFKKAGTVKITATAKDGSGKSNWVKLTYAPKSGKSAESEIIEIQVEGTTAGWPELFLIEEPGMSVVPIPVFEEK